jgi:polyferredoxin
MARLLKIIVTYIALSAIAAVFVLIGLFPWHPTTADGWGLFLVLALPLTIVCELIGEALWRNRLAQAVEEKTKERSLSGLRILYALVVMLLLFSLVFAVAQFIEYQ